MIDFKKFCSDDELRSSIALPFKKNGNVYATNGHIAIRANESLWTGEVNDSGDTPNVDRVLPDVSLINNWIKPPALLDCEKCANTGQMSEKLFCDCTPRIFDMRIQRRYFELIHSLPRAEFGFAGKPDRASNKVISFKFDGGDGGVMAICDSKE